MKKITCIGGSIIIAITLSSLSAYLGLILAFSGAGGILTQLFWYIFPPFILIISIYFGYKNSKLENPSRVFSWTVRICSIIILGYLVWLISSVMRSNNYSNQMMESDIVLPKI